MDILTEEIRKEAFYVGDGLYMVDMKDGNMLLFASDGISITNKVYINIDNVEAIVNTLKHHFNLK